MNIRQLTDFDKPTLEAWISRDPDHTARKLTAEFFFTPMTLSMMFEDDKGPVFAVRLDPEMNGSVRIHIQFDSGQMVRTARMLKQGFPIVRDRVQQSSARRMVFDSVAESLVDFCKYRFGFSEVEGTQDLELVLQEAAA
jgi:hypothetical protein